MSVMCMLVNEVKDVSLMKSYWSFVATTLQPSTDSSTLSLVIRDFLDGKDALTDDSIQ